MFLHRIGCFLLLIGAGLSLLFFASDASLQTDYNYLFWAAAAALPGFWLWRRFRPRSTKSQRFRMLRRRSADEEELPPDEM
jgi:hypothetical protein